MVRRSLTTVENSMALDMFEPNINEASLYMGGAPWNFNHVPEDTGSEPPVWHDATHPA